MPRRQTHQTEPHGIVEQEIEDEEAETQAVIQTPEHDHFQDKDFFYEYLLERYDGFESLFEFLKLKPLVFLALQPIVGDIYLDKRGRKSFFNNPNDRLLLLYLFCRYNNLKMIRDMCIPYIRTNEQISREIDLSASLFRVPLQNACIAFRNENLLNTGVSSIVDCTVTPTRRPNGDFASAMGFYSGKYKMYCVKVEVIVNAESGTASFVSKAVQGADHDMTILKNTSETINNMLGTTKIIGDKGYKGFDLYIPTGSVSKESPLKEKGCLIERYFGRIKMVFKFTREKYLKDFVSFDNLFVISCCFCNEDIEINPLENQDATNYMNIMTNYLNKIEKRREAHKKSSLIYRRRQREQFDVLENELRLIQEEESQNSDETEIEHFD
ncbi:hypothetical protein EIN_328430 [Entamoeba invadens IP1]|uniref:DDE Tnp4 domain-containing protein n=1 Tax=Entamoeba invadens IP1 TaxID=370355 RepID=A0A0A1U3L1_ENTIV|nr:hypothetical protein EIN_328430 [Entamoeba invadens IP1]ELP86166.1 hypothetical protein EIN_328430 [Entamoeba invadens IP1]|eukprot:XP_004185512.1 hypothetical protein EIN_328430 [Entamoeba invadens IP1]